MIVGRGREATSHNTPYACLWTAAGHDVEIRLTDLFFMMHLTALPLRELTRGMLVRAV